MGAPKDKLFNPTRGGQAVIGDPMNLFPLSQLSNIIVVISLLGYLTAYEKYSCFLFPFDADAVLLHWPDYFR